MRTGYRHTVDWRRLYREGLSSMRGTPLPGRISTFVAPYTEREVLCVVLLPWDREHQDQVRTLIWAAAQVLQAARQPDGLRAALGHLWELWRR